MVKEGLIDTFVVRIYNGEEKSEYRFDTLEKAKEFLKGNNQTFLIKFGIHGTADLYGKEYATLNYYKQFKNYKPLEYKCDKCGESLKLK